MCETPLSWHRECSLPVAVRVSKARVLKLPITARDECSPWRDMGSQKRLVPTPFPAKTYGTQPTTNRAGTFPVSYAG